MIGVIGVVVFKVFLNPVTNHLASPMGPVVHLVRGLGWNLTAGDYWRLKMP